MDPPCIVAHEDGVEGAVDVVLQRKLLESELEEGAPLPEVCLVHVDGDRKYGTWLWMLIIITVAAENGLSRKGIGKWIGGRAGGMGARRGREQRKNGADRDRISLIPCKHGMLNGSLVYTSR